MRWLGGGFLSKDFLAQAETLIADSSISHRNQRSVPVAYSVAKNATVRWW